MVDDDEAEPLMTSVPVLPASVARESPVASTQRSVLLPLWPTAAAGGRHPQWHSPSAGLPCLPPLRHCSSGHLGQTSESDP